MLSFINAPDYEDPMGAGADPADPVNGYEVIIKVTDDGTPAMGDTLEVAFSVTNVNEPPQIPILNDDRQEHEGTPTSEILATYTASDPESDRLMWTLAGADAGAFTIGSGSGDLRFADVPDYEDPADQDEDNLYQVTVQVSDGKNA
ncbi:MAG: cadherin repeat domain-containing protein [Chloroflexota bacterium]|nr:cadherin repeat domain-containing protein [Chloroflexota bacterium]MDE2894019.1 cadherin repeat domain-containing protein [Chloroflexota bacterium]